MAAALLVLGLMFCLHHAGAQTILYEVTGSLEVYNVHVPPERERTTYFLANPNEPSAPELVHRAQLLFKTDPLNLVTGDKIRALVRRAFPTVAALAVHSGVVADSTADVLQVEEYQVDQENPSKNFNYTGGVTRITSITMIANICGQKGSSNIKQFKSQWLNKYNPTAGTEFNTLENYYKECSYGKAEFNGDDNVVLDLTDYMIPCHGTWQLQSFSSSRCGTAEMFGWMEAAQKEAIRRGYNLNMYTRRVMIIPDNNCPWTGLGSIGCGKYCLTWLKGPYVANGLSVAFHELGHNLGLQHATTPGVEYGDGSCTMGGCCGNRCFNAPHAWQTAWAKPMAVLNGTSLPVGVWSTFTLPAAATTDTNHVQVVPTWLGTASQPVYTPAYFFSYRQPVGWDRYLLFQYQGGVNVHVFNGTQVVGPYKTELEGVVSVGSAIDNKAIKVMFKFLSKTSNTAVISLCRYTGQAETNCFDGLDNDCNGLVDKADPACRTASPPPSPKPTCNNNGKCDAPSETYETCPHDCPLRCGDGKCLGAETARTCPQDCPAVCGDHYCDLTRGETALTCPQDCPPDCGDGFCDRARGESAANCKGDCKPVCGDKYCDSTRSENAQTCPQDCPAVCGDGLCTGNETSMSCRKDCPVRCGDRFCDISAGEQKTCARDCPASPKPASPKPSPRPPPGRSPKPSPRPSHHPSPKLAPKPSPHRSPKPSPKHSPKPSPRPSPRPSPKPSPLPSPKPTLPSPRTSPTPSPPVFPHSPRFFVPVQGPRQLVQLQSTQAELLDPVARAAYADMLLMYPGICGDDRCWGDESASSCPEDCPHVCGDGFCDKHRQETTLSCPEDCKPAPCGDGICADSETAHNCPEDCCPMSHISCGDGICQAYAGENCLTCPQDCAGSVEAGVCCGAHLTCDLEQCTDNGLECVMDCA